MMQFEAARKRAADRFADMGAPQARDEYWRYTKPMDFNAKEVKPYASSEVEATDLFAGMDRALVVFTDGRFDAEASDLRGLEIAQLGDQTDWAEGLYGTLEAAGQSPVPRPLAAANTAHARDGVLIHVRQTPAVPVQILYRRDSDSADVVLHHVIRVEPGAELTLLESGVAGARSNTVIEVDLAETARFHHVWTRPSDCALLAVGHIFARVAEKAVFKSFGLSLGGRLMRYEHIIDIQGDDAVAHVAGAAMGQDGFHHDDTVFITHGAERGESRQVFKKVLKSGAVGVFQGKILVKPGAQKTDGYQISQALLLDEDAQFLGKPELEIYADDVRCSHGSTTGAIDETALFYLRSRGVPKDRALVLLILSFLADALEEVESDDLRDRITAGLEHWLMGDG